MSERASFDAVSVTRAGGREVNEDYVDVLHTADASCWVIADGLGGHRGGAIASKLVVESALRSFQEQPAVAAEQVERHCEQAQEALLAAQRSDASLAQMRSTIVVFVANEREAVWGHVGDTRLYHLRGGRVVSRTRDHSVSQALVDGGQIDQRQQGVHEDRSRLLRSLGKDGEPARPTIAGPVTLCRDDAFLLCTDGFWEALDETAVEIDYAGSEDAPAWLDRLDARLRAQDIPLKDNYTAAVVRLLNEVAPAPPPHEPRRPTANGPRRPSGPMAVPGVVDSASDRDAAANEVARDSRPGAAAGNGAPTTVGSNSVFGAHRDTVMRVLYVAMAIALAALLYTAYVAYQRYAAATGHETPPALVHDPAVSVKPVAPDPEVKTPTPPKDHDGEVVKPDKADKAEPEKADDDTKAASRPKKP